MGRSTQGREGKLLCSVWVSLRGPLTVSGSFEENKIPIWSVSLLGSSVHFSRFLFLYRFFPRIYLRGCRRREFTVDEADKQSELASRFVCSDSVTAWRKSCVSSTRCLFLLLFSCAIWSLLLIRLHFTDRHSVLLLLPPMANFEVVCMGCFG